MKAVEQAWLDHNLYVKRFVARRVAASNVDDIVVDIFVIALSKWSGRSSIHLAYLYGIARKVIANHQRKHRRREAIDKLLLGQQSQPHVPQDECPRFDLSTLPPRQLQALQLATWEQLTDKEGAAVMGGTPAAFRMNVSRARQRLRSDSRKNQND